MGEQKNYIQQFAAESFSFLMRKIRDSSKLFDILFSALDSEPDLCQGLGFLCFEMIKGVKKQFHSMTDSVLPVLFSKTGVFQNKSVGVVHCLQWELVFKSLVHMLERMARYTVKEHCQVVEKSLVLELQRLWNVWNNKQYSGEQEESLKSQIGFLLRLTNVWVSWKSGSLISDPVQLFNVVQTMMVNDFTSDVIASPLLELASTLLQTSFTELSKDRFQKQLTLKVFNSVNSREQLFTFCKHVLKWENFQTDVLPFLLNCCQEELLKGSSKLEEVFLILTEVIVQNAPRSEGGLDLSSLKGMIFFPKCGTKQGGKILQAFLDNLTLDDGTLLDKNRLCLIWSILVCIPCISPLDIPQCCSQLLSFIHSLNERLLSDKFVGNVVECLSMLSQAIQSYTLTVASADEIVQHLDFAFLLTLIRSWPDNVHVLQACFKMMEVARKHGIKSFVSERNLHEVYSYLRLNLCSASHVVRLLTLKILSCFDQPERSSSDNKVLASCSIFKLCLSAEEVPAHLDTYRDKLVCLQRLRFTSALYDSLPDLCRDAALLHLSGMLYVNFSPMWDPVIEIIASFAQSSNVMNFWKIFSELLHTSAEKTEKALDEDMGANSNKEPAIENGESVGSKAIKCLDEIFGRHNSASLGARDQNRADHVNFRQLLWKAMASFPEIAEQKSRDVVPLFLRFVSNEYFVAMENVAPSQDIRAKHSAEQQGTPTEPDSSETEADNTTEEPQGNLHKRRHKSATKSLCTHLTLFTSFKNPKALFKESEVRQLLMRFLAHREAEVQKLAFQCLLTYKFYYLEPYRENIDRLLDDEIFRDELAHFSVDEDNGIVVKSHRDGLMPILIRLLYGKMQRWTGAGTGGRAGVGMRRAVVLRFLASCPQQEIQIFMDLILAPFKHLCTDDPGLIVTTATDLSSVVPLKKQQGFLGMVSQILNKMGNLASSFLPSILQIVLSLLSTCVFALEHREKVHPAFVSQMKTVRQLAVTRLTEFFEFMTDYDFKPICDSVFSTAVWPQIEKLNQESIQHPTPLLKLLFAWSKNSRFFPLLSRKPTEKPDLSIMSCVFACLHVPSVSEDVVAMVMEMTDNLLARSQSEIGDEESDLLECGSEMTITSNYDHDNKASYGTLLVLPHISGILEYLSHSVQRAINNSKRKNKGKVILPQRELSVLSKISPFVKDAKQSATLIDVLLPFLSSSQKEETANNILKTVKSLLANVERPREFVTLLSKLFSQINTRSTRQCLCDVFLELANVDSSFSPDACEILARLNAWSAKRLEEPDYDARLEGFANAKLLVEQDALKTDEILPLLHNCIYFVLCSDDLSIRDSAGSCMTCIVRYVVQRSGVKDERFHVLIMKCLLPACRKALSSKKESARNEFLDVLSTMVREFEHDSFTDLKVLLDDDPEKDFFENIKHIQLHRRIRALRRLQAHCQQHSLRTTSLTAYLLPLVTHCVFDHTAAKEHNLVTEAVATIGTISACLPWSKYCSLLRHYLKLLPVERQFQKVIVRVVVLILNNFHFDLSSVPKQMENAKFSESSPGVKNTETNKVESEFVRTEDPIKRPNEPDSGGDNDNDDDEDDERGDEELVAKEEVSDLSKEELALRIYNTITSTILPQLHKCVTKKSKSADYHRLSQLKAEDEEEMLRVPIILAIVKLLQALPEHALHLHLPGLLLRICHTLKSRAREVRDAARDTLAKITVSLGAQYFSFVLKELRSSLTRGYQLHVLSFTIHTLLDKMSDSLEPGKLDPCLQGLVEVLVEDLFGEAAKEREVEKIANKLPEAKTCKSFDTYEILAKFAGTRSLTGLVSPLKEVLDSTQSHKTARRVEEVLRRIGVGLQANSSLTPQILLVFIHGLTRENIPLLKSKPEEKKEAPTQADPRHRPGSSLLLPPAPTRGGNVPQTSTKTNHHILVEFGLQLLYMMLKHGKISSSDQEHQQMVDPFVGLLTDCLKSKYNKVVTISLRCVSWLVKFPLPSLDRCVPTIGKLLFNLLKNYAKAGAKVGENFEMVLSAFKAMTVIIRDFNQYTVAEKHLQVLLGFVEEDIHDHTRQGTAFPLLKAILSRKLTVPEIHDVMWKVGQLSITGSSPSVQLQCRQCMLQFLLDYPLGTKLQRFLEFYVSQLSYEHETGRESALEMIESMLSTFPESMLIEYAGFFFVPLTSRLVNDDSAACRKLTALAIKSLLAKIDVDQRQKLFSIVLLWFKDEKISLQRLAAQVSGLFVEVEEKNFEKRLGTVLPLVASLISPVQLKMDAPVEEDEQVSSSEGLHRIKDHLLFNTLSFLVKVFQHCQVIKNPSRQHDMAQIWESVEAHLLHPHAWVRLVSSRLLGLLFAAWKPEELVAGYQRGTTSLDYLQEDLPTKVAKLCDDFCTQLRSPLLENELGEQIVKNLVFLAKTLQILDGKTESRMERQRTTSAREENLSAQKGTCLTLTTLLNNMNKLAILEASQTPKHTKKRSCVLRWVAAVSINLGKDGIEPHLADILSPVYRELELATTFIDSDLQKLAQEVLELIKSLVERETFSRAYASLQQTTTDARETRKRKKALEAVADPAKSARKKLKKNLAKKETRKRKIDSIKPERKLKASRRQEH